MAHRYIYIYIHFIYIYFTYIYIDPYFDVADLSNAMEVAKGTFEGLFLDCESMRIIYMHRMCAYFWATFLFNKYTFEGLFLDCEPMHDLHASYVGLFLGYVSLQYTI